MAEERRRQLRFPAPGGRQAAEGRQGGDQVHRDGARDRQGDVREEERQHQDGGGARRHPGREHRRPVL